MALQVVMILVVQFICSGLTPNGFGKTALLKYKNKVKEIQIGKVASRL